MQTKKCHDLEDLILFSHSLINQYAITDIKTDGVNVEYKWNGERRTTTVVELTLHYINEKVS